MLSSNKKKVRVWQRHLSRVQQEQRHELRLPPNKKKLRGWKRHIGKLERWKQTQLPLSLKLLNAYQCEYVKIWLDPWYRLEKRNPPVWFRRLILAALIEIYDAWHEQLRTLDQSFYLKIWFYEPHFINSQVVAAIGERISYYENIFTPDDSEKRFPYAQYGLGNPQLNAFVWQRYQDETFCFEQADELTPEEFARLKNQASRIEQVGGDSVLVFRHGDIFVGERPLQ